MDKRSLRAGVAEPTGPKKVTIKMPADMKTNLPAKIIHDGYNMREKSKWVSEALEFLLRQDAWEGALLSQLSVSTDTQDVFTIPSNLHSEMMDAIRAVNIRQPSLNANQSTVIRAAIQRRLLGLMFISRRRSA